MSTTDSLRLEPATLEDIPAITELWFAAFTEPPMRNLFPDTPGVRQWWDETNRHDLLHKPRQRYLKVVDAKSNDPQGRPRLIAYAKWDLGTIEERQRRFLPWHGDMPGRECEAFFSRLDGERKRVMGDRKHYYLDMLATHPEYWRRGAASMLIRWGCDLADSERVEAYVDASKRGAPLYQKFGFVDHSESAEELASMARGQSEI